VIGCHRSGTALLYDSLLSAGGFPIYQAAPFVHTQMIQMSGDPAVPKNREKLLQLWLRSKAFRRTGFAPDDLRHKILEECKTGGDFLKITMGELARRVGVQRWAVYDIDNIMHMLAIKREIPDALFVHVVRDGRDAAVSMEKQHSGRPLLWARERGIFAWALLWQWTVRKGRRSGQKVPADYIEISYEDLVRDPRETLRTLGDFLDHDLDYDRIQKTAVGRVSSPNTIWKDESNQENFSPIDRWKSKLSQSEAADLEALIGEGLKEFGYPLTTEPRSSLRLDPRLSLMRILYPQYFEAKVFLQSRTIVGRRAKGTRLELSDPI
jgi:LPS sulfotransferase NodH